ncbi:hypothetical protein K2X30_04960, partial [bacterium]|nr:hypothetical protein [bacterium]
CFMLEMRGIVSNQLLRLSKHTPARVLLLHKLSAQQVLTTTPYFSIPAPRTAHPQTKPKLSLRISDEIKKVRHFCAQKQLKSRKLKKFCFGQECVVFLRRAKFF